MLTNNDYDKRTLNVKLSEESMAPEENRKSAKRSAGQQLVIICTIIGLVLAALGVVATVATPEIRCFLHLACEKSDEGITPGPEEPTVPDNVRAAQLLAETAEAPVGIASQGSDPVASTELRSITNRGEPVVVALTGSGFTSNGTVALAWYGPNAVPNLSSNINVDAQGQIFTYLEWSPYQYLGVEGNNGRWPISLTDDSSGKNIVVDIFVRSDEDTPPASAWGGPVEHEAIGNPGISVSTNAGTLCDEHGVAVELQTEGFTPLAAVTVIFETPSGEKLLEVGSTIDAAGHLEAADTYWTVAGCPTTGQAGLIITITDSEGIAAKSSTALDAE